MVGRLLHELSVRVCNDGLVERVPYVLCLKCSTAVPDVYVLTLVGARAEGKTGTTEVGSTDWQREKFAFELSLAVRN